VQWCIDYATPKQRKRLVDVVVSNSLELAQDAFGNYVVQQIMDPTHPEVLQKLVSHLAGSVNKLAVQKFSSIVIEKCLEYTESTQQMQIINELVNPVKLPRLLQDPYDKLFNIFLVIGTPVFSCVVLFSLTVLTLDVAVCQE